MKFWNARRGGTAYAALLMACTSAFALALPAAASAQGAGAAQDFSIAAGPLAQALQAYSAATGIQLVYSSELVEGKRSSGVSGNMPRTEALTRLLAGTGLSGAVSGNTATISAAVGADGEKVTGAVRVEGAQGSPYFGGAGVAAGVNGTNGSRDITATEGTGSFTSGALTIGSKAPQAIKDVPQSVSVITSERLEQQNINDFTTALQQAPGISFAQGGSNLETTFYSRGFAINSIQIDGGAPLSTGFGIGYGETGYYPLIDMSQYDHVEVLRGADGLFNGYGSPGGTVNLVRKKPLDHGQVTIDGEAGSWDHYRTVVDVTGPLNVDGRLRGRLVATWESDHHFYEVAKDQKQLLYGTLEYDLTPTTLVSAGLSQNTQNSTPWFSGLPRYQTGADLNLPRSTALAFPWNRWNMNTTEIFGSLEQKIGKDWSLKFSLTNNQQANTLKYGSSTGSVNPIDNRGPRLSGAYAVRAADQMAVEATLAGAFTIFGQRQEITLGANRSDQDGGGFTAYQPLITSSAAAPYQPYPGGPKFCTTISVCPVGVASPPINVFAFNPNDAVYTEPANPLRNYSYPVNGQVQTLAYANLRLTAFDKVHLETGLRWSQYQYKTSGVSYCTAIPVTGPASPTNCFGRQIGDAYNPSHTTYTGHNFAWPPKVALSYDATKNLTAYLSYTDIYIDQSTNLDENVRPLKPVTGSNIEAGLKWAPKNSRLNVTLAAYRIEQSGFAEYDPNIKYKLNPDGSIYRDINGNLFVVAANGTEILNGNIDAYHSCCYIQYNLKNVVEGFDAELAGQVTKGWQVSASYTFSQTKEEGSDAFSAQGQPFLSIQPKSLYKLWTSYDFGTAGAKGWLSNLSVSGGVNGQSKGFNSGTTCPSNQVGQPDPLTGIARCLVAQVPFQFTVKPYAVFSGRIDYRFNKRLSAALYLQNLLDKTYYQSVGSDPNGGNWYGTPRSATISLRAKW